MHSLYPPRLDDTTKEEIHSYFLNTYDLFESLFDVLSPEAFYIKSEPTRHPMIFYYGHTAVFYINKLFASGLIEQRINPHFESIFAVGVDEMEWDNLDESHYKWPTLQEVKEYRKAVRQRVERFIEETPLQLPIGWEDPFWIVMMGCEHERIHIETSSVLHRQMPLEHIIQSERFKPCNGASASFPKNELVHIPAASIKLGKKHPHRYYGWDNEYGTYTERLESFEVSKYLVSNGEFMEFVEDGGYENEEYWDEEGKAFLHRHNAKHPPFWVRQENGKWLYRTYDRLVEMPMNFPVDVNALEAEAFCRWKSKKENKKYQLISEAEYRALYEHCYDKEIVSQEDANVNFAYGFSSTPVERFFHKELYDAVGNAWVWTRTPIDGFEGFEVHPAYDDFSTPTFDAKHNIIASASWASSGNLLMKHSRYAFRKHFFQHASFRYVVTPNDTLRIDANLESDPEVVEMLTEDYLTDNAASFVTHAIDYAEAKNKALDMGCKTGRSSFELAGYFTQVDGVDASARFIKVGVALKNRNYIKYDQSGQTKLLEFDTSAVADKVSFLQADERNLKPQLTGYDFVLYRGASQEFLNRLRHITNDGAVVVCLKSDIENIPGFTRRAPGVFKKSI